MKSSDLSQDKHISSISDVVGAVTKFGTQVKERISKVFEKKLGKSCYSQQSESLLSVTSQSSRPAYYGSLRNKSTFNIETNNNSKAENSDIKGYAIPATKSHSPEKLKDQNYALHQTPEISHHVCNFLSIDTSLKAPNTDASQSIQRRFSIDAESTLSDSYEVETFSWARILKIFVVVLIFMASATAIAMTIEDNPKYLRLTSSKYVPYYFPMKKFIPFAPWYPLLTLSINGAFATSKFANKTKERLRISVHFLKNESGESWNISEVWEIPIFPENSFSDVTLTHTFSLSNLTQVFSEFDGDCFVLYFETTTENSFPFLMAFKLLPNFTNNGVLFGGLVIIGLYTLIIFELINRTLSAILAATVAIGILSVFQERPSTEEIISWLDMETLILLFGIMVMVSILCETGFFNYCAYLMYKVTNGAIWPMITSLCMFTAIVSAFLDNVTTILLMTPVTIRICEAMRLNPVPVLISTVVFSNIGGAATPVGDPPNVIIANNPDVKKAAINFMSFSTHMSLGIVPVLIVSYIQLRLIFRSMSSLQFEVPYEIAELKREVEVWRRAAASLSSYSRDEIAVKTILQKKVLHLRRDYKLKRKTGGQTAEDYKATLVELEESCRIENWSLLIKCGIVLSIVMFLFCAQSIPNLNLSMGWTALLGAVLLMTIADRKELESILARVEWSTLIFFSALFVVMEAVSKLGLLEWIGNQTEAVIYSVDPESRTIVAILTILWVSGLASAFIDNIPFTTIMIKIVTKVATSLHLPLNPLVWALAFGTCLGGNGTLIGASANVVCAGVSDQHGYPFSFGNYFRIGFPIMIVSLVVASAYLTISYCIGFY